MRVEELADAQKQTEIHVDELARSQQEMRVTMQEMQASQRDMQGSLQAMQASQQEMQRAIIDLAKQVGGLSNAVGANLEDFACDLVPELLEKYWRFVTVSAGPEELTAAGGVG
jgi:2-polyprenyl-6-methoxyphenol hydroxylase-like FAD-dependent oxidoreductase